MNIFVIENGTVVELEDGNVRIGERIPGGYIFVEGSNVGEADKGVTASGNSWPILISFSST